MNDAYELIGGILATTPIDETNEYIESDYFAQAKQIADDLLAVRDFDTNVMAQIIKPLNNTLVNYMNSPFIDFIYTYRGHINRWLPNAARRNVMSVVVYLTDRNMLENTETAFKVAAACGHLPILQHLLKYSKPESWRVLLKCAALNNHINMTKYIISNHTRINTTDSSVRAIDGNKALVATNEMKHAAKAGNHKLVMYLFNHSLHTKESLNTALVYAAKYNRLNVVRYLIEHCKANVNDGHSLFEAAVENHMNVVKYLLKIHNIDAQIAFQRVVNDRNIPIIQYFCENASILNIDLAIDRCYIRSIEIIKCLLKRGASQLGYKTLFTTACQYGNLDVIKYLIVSGFDVRFSNDGLVEAIRCNQLSVVKYLYEECQFPINGALLLVAAERSFESLKYLINQGADIREYADSALRIAIIGYQIDIVKYLVETHNVDVGSGFKHVIHLAIERSRSDIIEYFIERGFDISNEPNMALSNAMYYSNDHFKYLINKNAYVAKDDRVVLNRAVLFNNLDAVKFLIENKGIETHKKDVKIFDDAVLRNYEDLIRYLLANGARVRVNHKQNAIVMAYLKSNPQVIVSWIL